MLKTYVILFMIMPFLSIAQNSTDKVSYTLIGTVVSGANNIPLTGANIINSNKIGTKTNELGEFSISTIAGDTLNISYIGFKAIQYICPKKESGKYLIKFKMYVDSISLREVEIFPYPTFKEFKEAFIAHDKQDEQIKIEGVKTYIDRDISYSAPTLFSPASFIYDKLFDKKAKTRRKITRRLNKIDDAAMDE